MIMVSCMHSLTGIPMYHQIQGSNCRPVPGNQSVTQSCHVCILPKISFLLIFVKCGKRSYFKHLGEKLGLQFVMRFVTVLASFIITLIWDRRFQGIVCVNYCGVCGSLLFILNH